jgi:hypothetical protein
LEHQSVGGNVKSGGNWKPQLCGGALFGWFVHTIIINVFVGDSIFQTDFVELHNVYAPVASNFRSAFLVAPSNSGVTQSRLPESIKLRTVSGGLHQPLRFLIESVSVAVSLAAVGNAVIWAQDPLLCGLSALIASRIAGATVAIDFHNDFLEGWTRRKREARVQRYIATNVAKRADRLRAVSTPAAAMRDCGLHS